MFRPSEFRDLVSGRRRGPAASLVRIALRVAETPYTAAVRRRNRRYDSGAAEVLRSGVPVVSVGNLTMGGTGKTPLVCWITKWFRRRGVAVAIVSRGYGRGGQQQNDEALEISRELPDVPHLQNPDRVAAAREAVARLGSRVIVLDDGFQHRRIGRDLDVALLDATEPFGYGHVFPRGTLREPAEGLRRADVVVLSRADLIPPIERQSIRQEAARLAPEAAWAEASHAPLALVSAAGEQEPVESLRGEAVAAFCGIGNPAGFRRTLDSCGYRVVGFREFADHHRYVPADIEALCRWAAGLDAATFVCTQKDLVKLDAERLGPLPLRALKIGIEFLSGAETIEARLRWQLV